MAAFVESLTAVPQWLTKWLCQSTEQTTFWVGEPRPNTLAEQEGVGTSGAKQWP